MEVLHPSKNAQFEVWFLGPVPPPVTGITLLTNEVLRSLKATGPVRFLSWSPGMSRPRLLMRLRRNLRLLNSLVKLLTNGRVQNARIYIAANSGLGLWQTAILVASACRLGFQVYLHHHSYAYIDSYDRRMAWIDRAMGTQGVHIAHCDQMADDFRARYLSKCRFVTIYPSIVSINCRRSKDSPNTPFCLGHLSNLTLDKGIDLVLQTFKVLHESGHRVCLKLAGPFHTPSARKMVEHAVQQYDGLVEYLGPVYGDAKQKFFAQLDVFLFPTRYKHESWGIVLNEALAAAVPAITCDRGCTRTVIGDRAGLVVDSDTEFVDRAVLLIRNWIERGDDYREASRAALEQAEHLHGKGQHMLREFAAHMFRPV